MPVLELDDGTVISECTANTEYIDSLTSERVLTGETPKERAVIHMMQRRAESNFLDVIHTFIMPCPVWGLILRDDSVLNGGNIREITLSAE